MYIVVISRSVADASVDPMAISERPIVDHTLATAYPVLSAPGRDILLRTYSKIMNGKPSSRNCFFNTYSTLVSETHRLLETFTFISLNNAIPRDAKEERYFWHCWAISLSWMHLWHSGWWRSVNNGMVVPTNRPLSIITGSIKTAMHIVTPGYWNKHFYYAHDSLELRRWLVSS